MGEIAEPKMSKLEKDEGNIEVDSAEQLGDNRALMGKPQS